MALNIANKRVEEKAQHVAHITGTNKTAAVEVALDEFLAAHQTNRDRREVSTLLTRLAALPVLDTRSADDLIGYDEAGLPR